MTITNKAAFFDRDGTLNVDVHYLYKKEDFVWMAGAIRTIQYCSEHGYKVIVITNQSGVARGYYTEADIQALHAWMNEDLKKHGAHIDAFYYCPHHPEGTIAEYARTCPCRKPGTKMLDDACRDFAIDRTQSFMVGDKPLDVECAERAGIHGVRFEGDNLFELVKKIV